MGADRPRVARGAAGPAAPGPDGVFQFIGIPGRVLDRYAASRRVRELAKAAGVRLTMHPLRKGFGCRHAARVPAQVLQKLMRHRSLKVTMD